jgi:hypothetical protein
MTKMKLVQREVLGIVMRRCRRSINHLSYALAALLISRGLQLSSANAIHGSGREFLAGFGSWRTA